MHIEEFLNAKLKHAQEVYKTTNYKHPLLEFAETHTHEELRQAAQIYMDAKRKEHKLKKVVDNTIKKL